MELELKAVVSHHVDTRNKTRALYKSSKLILVTEPSLQPLQFASEVSPPEAHVLRALVPSMVLLGRLEDFKRWGLGGSF